MEIWLTPWGFVKGGYVALVVEFADHLAVFEAGQSEVRGEQIIQQIREHISDKPIRYVINSHPHSDHTGGLIPFIREGATLVTHENIAGTNLDFDRYLAVHAAQVPQTKADLMATIGR